MKRILYTLISIILIAVVITITLLAKKNEMPTQKSEEKFLT